MKEGWEEKPLGEVCSVLNGLWKGKKPPFVTASVIRNTNFTKDCRLDLSDVAVLDVEEKQLAKRRLQPGDLVLEKSGGGPKQAVGRVILFKKTDGVFSFSNFTSILRVNQPDKIKPVYLHWFLYWVYLSGCTEGMQRRSTGIRNLDMSAYKAIPVRYPPLPEQRRIVAILDEAFEGIAAAKANAERNLKNAREVFEAAVNTSLDAASSKRCTRRLGDLVTRLTNGYVGPTRNIYTDTGVPYLLARHVKDNNLQFDEKTYVSDAFNKRNGKSILRIDDVLLVQSGHIGHAAVVPQEHDGHNCHAMIVISTKPGTVTGEFLSLFFNSSRMRQTFWAIRSGSTVPHLTCKAVKELEIPVLSAETQASLVARSKRLRSETDQLSAAAARKLAALDELKASLLHQAFTGNL